MAEWPMKGMGGQNGWTKAHYTVGHSQWYKNGGGANSWLRLGQNGLSHWFVVFLTHFVSGASLLYKCTIRSFLVSHFVRIFTHQVDFLFGSIFTSIMGSSSVSHVVVAFLFCLFFVCCFLDFFFKHSCSWQRFEARVWEVA